MQVDVRRKQDVSKGPYSPRQTRVMPAASLLDPFKDRGFDSQGPESAETRHWDPEDKAGEKLLAWQEWTYKMTCSAIGNRLDPGFLKRAKDPKDQSQGKTSVKSQIAHISDKKKYYT